MPILFTEKVFTDRLTLLKSADIICLRDVHCKAQTLLSFLQSLIAAPSSDVGNDAQAGSSEVWIKIGHSVEGKLDSIRSEVRLFVHYIHYNIISQVYTSAARQGFKQLDIRLTMAAVSAWFQLLVTLA